MDHNRVSSILLLPAVAFSVPSLFLPFSGLRQIFLPSWHTLPDGPKVGSVAVSPRGDLRMPSDASAALWMKELEQIRI